MHLVIEKYLCFFSVLVIMNESVTNIRVQVFVWPLSFQFVLVNTKEKNWVIWEACV